MLKLDPVKLDPVKIMSCKVCGIDVVVNANYPITEVTCLKCHAKAKYAGDHGDGTQSYGGTA